MKRVKSIYAAQSLGLIAVAALVAACGGGGGGGATSGPNGGTTAGTMTNKVAVTSNRVTPGASIGATATTSMRGQTPSAMVWTIAPLFAVPASSVAPRITDPQCGTATYAAPPFSTSQGTGFCKVAISVTTATPSGTWRLTNSASGGAGQISDFLDIEVEAKSSTASGGFRLIESSSALIGKTGSAISLFAPFTTTGSVQVSDVRYTWTAATDNPAKPLIAGASNSTATVTPTVPGQYQFNVSASALVNNERETSTATVVLIVETPPAEPIQLTPDSIAVTQPQIVQPGQLTTLSSAVIGFNAAASYTYSWSQLPVIDGGGPERVSFLNAGGSSVTFRAPQTSGTYAFEVTAVKTIGSGATLATVTSKARTSIIIDPIANPVFFLNAGQARIVSLNSVVLLTGAIAPQGASSSVVYEYLWTQIQPAFPAAVLSNANIATASFIANEPGTYNFNLRVTAKYSSTASAVVNATTQVIVQANPPSTFAISASAGTIQTKPTNTVVDLTGTRTVQGSTTGIVYAYQWSQVGATPASVNISSANNLSASFFPTVPGTYEFNFLVEGRLPDGTSRSSISTTQVVVGAVGGSGGGYVVSAGDAQTSLTGAAVTMTGAVTKQGAFDNATYEYSWTQVGATPAVVSISNANSPKASIVPTVVGTYTFLLTVTATQGGVQTVKTAQTQVLVKP